MASGRMLDLAVGVAVADMAMPDASTAALTADMCSSLAIMTPQPAVPNIGSKSHYLRLCRPCAFVHKGGCANGWECSFCHLCPAGEKRLRKKEHRRERIASRRRSM
mmetsp:Transcript_27943/g.88793  ORF Transcript_27943/g.88793 Transcript_27943/m.88793 type:complete len:106 (-) Transcript_27943:95-412(-)